MLTRLKAACGHEAGILSGVIEIDETYLSGKERDKHNKDKRRARRGPVGKQAVLGMRERDGRAKTIPIANTRKKTVQGAIHQNIEKGSTLYTGEHRRYKGLDEAHYNRESVNHSAGEYVSGDRHT